MTNPLRSLAGRIILLVFAATVVSALTVSWVSVQSLDGFLRAKVDQRFPEVAKRVSRELDQWYTLRTREIEVFAGSKILSESVQHIGRRGPRGRRAVDEADQYLRYVLESFPQYERLTLATPTGEALIEVGDQRPLPVGLLSHVTPSLEASSISDALRIGDSIVQIASAPMHDANGRTIGRLFAMIDLELLAPALESRELGETAAVFIIDRDQRFLNPPEGLDPDTNFSTTATAASVAPLVAGVAHYYNVQGLRVVGSQLAFPRFGWTLVLEQPYADAFAPVMGSLWRVAGLNLGIVLIVSLVATRLARSFVHPLRALSEAAKRLSEGEREVEIEEKAYASDEVNLLTRTFNEMSHRLSGNARELEESHRAVESANDELVTKNRELSSMNLVLEQLSITDGLTKLHNHRYFQESISKECKRSQRLSTPLSLILIDIDFFKHWNDRLGHAGGDEILRRLAEVLNVCVRETDILTRYGGEEFALLALNTDLEGAVTLAEKIRQTVEQEEFVKDVPSEKDQLTVSVGVAFLESDRQQLFADADSALYAAKNAGRNRVEVVGKHKRAAKSKPESKPKKTRAARTPRK